MLEQGILLSGSMREWKNFTFLNLFLQQSFQDIFFFLLLVTYCILDAEWTQFCLFKLAARQLTKSLMITAIQKYMSAERTVIFN